MRAFIEAAAGTSYGEIYIRLVIWFSSVRSPQSQPAISCSFQRYLLCRLHRMEQTELDVASAVRMRVSGACVRDGPSASLL
jgi:hypothetical protein